MLPTETLARIQDTAVRSKGVRIHQIPGVPEKLIIEQDGESDTLDIPPLRKNFRCDGVADFAACVKDHGNDSSPVFFSFGSATALLEVEDRRDRVRIEFRPSSKWGELVGVNAKPLKGRPKQVVRFLRQKLADSGDRITRVIQGLSRLDFTRSSTGHSHLEHGRESLGQAVEASVQQADEVPETFDVTLRPFTNDGLGDVTVTIEIGVEIDLEDQEVALYVLPDQIERARTSALRQVRDALSKAMPQPLYQGMPGDA